MWYHANFLVFMTHYSFLSCVGIPCPSDAWSGWAYQILTGVSWVAKQKIQVIHASSRAYDRVTRHVVQSQSLTPHSEPWKEPTKGCHYTLVQSRDARPDQHHHTDERLFDMRVLHAPYCGSKKKNYWTIRPASHWVSFCQLTSIQGLSLLALLLGVCFFCCFWVQNKH